MADKTSVCNKALANLRRDRTVQDVDTEDTAEAKTCRLYFDDVRDQVLEAHDWQFASRVVQLATHTESPPVDWTHRYEWPGGNCVAARQLFTSGMSRQSEPLPFKAELTDDGTQLTILADTESSYLRYTSRVLDVNKWAPAFQEAVVWLLTSEMSMALRGKADVSQSSFAMYQRALQSAKTQDFSSQYGGPAGSPLSLRARS